MSIFRPDILAGKVAFVTGADRGIGQPIAERYAEHGARVIFGDGCPERVDAVVAQIRSRGGVADFVADVRSFESIEAVLHRSHDLWGPIDTLLCAVGGNFSAMVADLSDDVYKEIVHFVHDGTLDTCRAAYPFLRKPGASILSVCFQPIPHAYFDGETAGVDVLMSIFAVGWGKYGIRANCLAPAQTENSEGPSREALPVTPGVPLRRYGTRDELADVAVFLASDAAAYITGGVFFCDGGSSLSWRLPGGERKAAKLLKWR